MPEFRKPSKHCVTTHPSVRLASEAITLSLLSVEMPVNDYIKFGVRGKSDYGLEHYFMADHRLKLE